MRLNENIYAIQMTLPINGSPSNTTIAELRLLDSTVFEVWIYASSNTLAFYRMKDVEGDLIPINGSYINATAGAVNLKLERVLNGPPWVIEIEGYNTSGSITVTLNIIVKAGSERETDLDYSILEELQDINRLLQHKILGTPINEFSDGD